MGLGSFHMRNYPAHIVLCCQYGLHGMLTKNQTPINDRKKCVTH